MAILEIKYAYNETVAFTIHSVLYYLKIGPDLPELYDQDLKKLIIPNIDHWIQAQTQQRYTYRGLKDMMEAFVDGLRHGYDRDDMEKVCNKVFDDTIKNIFRTKHARDYALAYWIELLDQKRVQKMIGEVRNGFDEYRSRLGDNKLYSYLCRLWQFCHFNDPSDSEVVEKLISRLGKKPQGPTYPEPDVQRAIRKYVVSESVIQHISPHKDVSREVMENVNDIQSTGL